MWPLSAAARARSGPMPPSVVGDQQHDLAVLAGHGHGDMRGVGVAGGVGDQLACDREQQAVMLGALHRGVDRDEGRRAGRGRRRPPAARRAGRPRRAGAGAGRRWRAHVGHGVVDAGPGPRHVGRRRDQLLAGRRAGSASPRRAAPRPAAAARGPRASSACATSARPALGQLLDRGPAAPLEHDGEQPRRQCGHRQVGELCELERARALHARGRVDGAMVANADTARPETGQRHPRRQDRGRHQRHQEEREPQLRERARRTCRRAPR